VELVEKTLPKLTINETAEEITEGDEETDTQAHENGNENSQDKTEGGEPMDTS
ncbi:DNA-directed RNA polymerase III subunit RPC3-like, partial [Trifolium medium]|nr:DNA-directed RNA polymerase III subunit RPC3-like [Trifolium medium]